MGYYTNYTLEVHGELDQETVASEDYGITVADLINGELDSMKWYDHDSDMKKLSERYPTVLFVLTGEGEETGDLWKDWYRSGRGIHVDAEIVFPEPDIDTLLPVDDSLVKEQNQQALTIAVEALEDAQAVVEKLKAEVDKYK